jgi:hypothetical protein
MKNAEIKLPADDGTYTMEVELTPEMRDEILTIVPVNSENLRLAQKTRLGIGIRYLISMMHLTSASQTRYLLTARN